MAKKICLTLSYLSLLLTVSGFKGCYRIAGQGDALPSHIHTIAIPAFQNPSLRFKVEQIFTSAMIDEVLRRNRSLKVSSTAEGTDAVLSGVIKSFSARPVLATDDPGKPSFARLYEVTIVVGVTVRDQVKNKILFDNQNYVFRGEYEVGPDQKTFFNEQSPAVTRIAKDFAKSLAATILEGF